MLPPALFLLAPATALAAFPGPNGRIAFAKSHPAPEATPELWTMRPDGTMPTRLTSNSVIDEEPAWSADGRSLAFRRAADVWAMNADGSGQTQLTTHSAFDGGPAWSPDGTKLVFTSTRTANTDEDLYTMNSDGSGQAFLFGASGDHEGEPAWKPDGSKIAFRYWGSSGAEIAVIDANGTGQLNLTNSAGDNRYPDWSPDGTKIVFESNRTGDYEIYVMNADGSGQTNMTQSPGRDNLPAWSPDGSKIAFTSERDGKSEIYIMNANGTGQTRLTTVGLGNYDPDWQAQTPHDRPAAADDLNVSLVPDFRQTISSTQCAARGGVASTHGPPLSFSSCAPPAFVLGVTAHMGAQASGSASLHVFTCPLCDGPFNADVIFNAAITDIRTGSATGPDYDPSASAADARLVSRWRISDTESGPAATLVDIDFPVPVTCTATPDPGIGSSCNASTGANAVAPGSIVYGQQAVVQSFRVRVADAGLDGSVGTSDDRNFAQQGIYIP